MSNQIPSNSSLKDTPRPSAIFLIFTIEIFLRPASTEAK